MLTTVEGFYKDGKIELAEIPAGLKQAQVLVTFLPETVPTAQPQVLHGIWQGKMPGDLDIEATLTALRNEWRHNPENDAHE